MAKIHGSSPELLSLVHAKIRTEKQRVSQARLRLFRRAVMESYEEALNDLLKGWYYI